MRRACFFTWTLRAATGCAVGCAVAACSNPDTAVGFKEQSPNARMRAIHQAAATNDRSAIPDLIGLLQSDDPAERLLAIRTLEQLTGQTLGYDHAATRDERRAAVQRWAEWYRSAGPANNGGPGGSDGPMGEGARRRPDGAGS